MLFQVFSIGYVSNVTYSYGNTQCLSLLSQGMIFLQQHVTNYKSNKILHGISHAIFMTANVSVYPKNSK